VNVKSRHLARLGAVAACNGRGPATITLLETLVATKKVKAPADTTRDRMVTAAATLFQSQGYHGTGLIQLLQTSDAPKGSFYHHFPNGKEELAEAAVLQSGEAIRQLIDKGFAKASTFAGGAQRFATLVADWFEASDFGKGCPITSVLLETVPSSPRLTNACRTVFDAWIDTAAAHAARLGRVKDAAELGEGLVIAIEGAWIVSRAQRSRRAFDIAIALMAKSSAK
jgi:TetR/AcrR family transcriptional regulator, lmrAB and yxaGH operons repressor